MTLKVHPADGKAFKAYQKKKGISEEDAFHKVLNGAFNRWAALRKYQHKKKAARTAKKGGKKLKKAA